MTGPQHFQKAENWVFKAQNSDARGAYETAESCAAIAQVHATLALAAATALKGGEASGLPIEDFLAWDKAAGVQDAAGTAVTP